MPDKESFIPKDWFKKAEEDLRAAEILLKEESLGIAGFLLQQAVEKYLKGYLLSRGWELKRIHDLVDLLNEVVTYDKSFDIYRSTCQQITEYYTEERYPFLDTSELTREEIETALNEAKSLRDKIRAIL
jgi:HEPN domain-containing protein